MYIAKKVISGKNYYYLRESRRENGKVKSINIGYGGKTLEEAKKKMKELKKKDSVGIKKPESTNISIEELTNWLSGSLSQIQIK